MHFFKSNFTVVCSYGSNWQVSISSGNGLVSEQGAKHYLNQWWPRCLMPSGIDRPQWVNPIMSEKSVEYDKNGCIWSSGLFTPFYGFHDIIRKCPWVCACGTFHIGQRILFRSPIMRYWNFPCNFHDTLKCTIKLIAVVRLGSFCQIKEVCRSSLNNVPGRSVDNKSALV